MGTKRHAILLIGALLLSHQGFAAEFTVNNTEDAVDLTPGDGVCVTATGQCTLRAAIQETNALNGADTINLPSSTYELTRPRDTSLCDFACPELLTDERGDLDITDELTIIGSGSETTVIDALSIQSIDDRVSNARVLHIGPEATVELRGLLIRGGRDIGGGGGIFNAGALTLRDCDVSGNEGLRGFWGPGGGILNEGTLTLNETSVHHNNAGGSGGGISNSGNLSMTGSSLNSNRVDVTGSSISNCSAGRGGGLATSGAAILSGVTIARNVISKCPIYNGSSSSAGILNSEGQLTLDNSTVSDNIGGGHDMFGNRYTADEIVNFAQMTLNNVTIGELGLRNEGTMQLQNTLIASSGVDGFDPLLGRLQDNGGSTETRALLPGSPAIDAGDAATCEATDQRGISRPLDGDLNGQPVCDIGAYEADGSEQAKPWLAAAVLPGSRSVLVGNPATAFATILSTGHLAATECTIASTNGPGDFLYQTTDPITNELTGTLNTAADIEPGAGQTFLIAFIPNSEILETVAQLQFVCTNTDPAPVINGVNTLLLSASTVPIPDIVAVNATINNDGIVTIPGDTGSGVFAVATVNVGAAGPITVSADTGSVALPVNVFVCETNPNTSVCLAEPGPEVTTTIESNATPTFGVFVVSEGTVPFDPANNRIFVRFAEEDGDTRGLTSVAVTTAP
jgi:CSLREA domain-containing protein